jgi:hypothetical protein
MELHAIFNQLTSTYGQPTPTRWPRTWYSCRHCIHRCTHPTYPIRNLYGASRCARWLACSWWWGRWLDHWAADPYLRRPCPAICAMLGRCTPTSSRNLSIRMYVFLVILMWRMDICPKHALRHGGLSTTRRVLIITMPISISQWGTIHVHKGNAQESISGKLTAWGRAGRT